MAVDPNVQIYNSADDAVITAINFATGDAGAYVLSSAGVEYHIWNDKGAVLGSSKMTSVKITVRDSDGQEIEPLTYQHWVEIKSTTIEEGADGGDASDETDDDMADFQPVGKDAYLSIGDIPSDCYRIIFVRVNLPTSAIQAGVTFSIYVTNQEPAASITKWHTGIHGDGVIPSGNMLEVTDNAGADSKVDIASGYALINDIEIINGASQTYTISTTDATYKIYLSRAGVISSTTGDIPSNSLEIARVVIASNVVSSVTDKRVFIGNVRSGLDAAKTATPHIGMIYIATDTKITYTCYTVDTWTALNAKKAEMIHFQDLKAASATHIHAAITGTGASQDITADITNPDVPRVATLTMTNVTTPSGIGTITGLVRGVSTTDAITLVAGGTATGVKPFDTITNINIPAGVTADDTVSVGIGDILGLPKEINLTTDVYKKKVNNEDKTIELSGNINATYGTVDCATIIANEETTLWYLADY